jgi:hypothetical protein
VWYRKYNRTIVSGKAKFGLGSSMEAISDGIDWVDTRGGILAAPEQHQGLILV